MVRDVKLKIDADLINQASYLFESLGMDLNTAMRVFLIQSIACNGLPFNVRFAEPKNETYKVMEEEEYYGPFENMKDFMEALNA